MNKTTRAPARSKRTAQPDAIEAPRAREDAQPTLDAAPSANSALQPAPQVKAVSPEDSPTLKAVRALRPRTPRAADPSLARESASAPEEPGTAAAHPLDAHDEAALAEEPAQPSQSTTKLHTLAIMAEVARRASAGNASAGNASAGNASDPQATPPAEVEASIPASAFLPPVPESLKERLRVSLGQPVVTENADQGAETRRDTGEEIGQDTNHDIDQDSGSATLSRLAVRAEVARSALRESLRRQHGATGTAEMPTSTADEDAASQTTRPTVRRPLAGEALRPDAPGHLPLPMVDLLPLLTTLHAGIGATAALVAGVLLLVRSPLVVLLLALAGLAGGSSMLASLLARSAARRAGAGAVLLVSQFAMLAWALALLGPRAALLFLVPAMALWALRVLGRGALGVVLVGTLLLYSCAAVLMLAGLLVPAIALGPSAAIVLDGALATLGLALTLGGVEGLLRASARAHARARARELDVASLRTRLGTQERDTALDVETVRTTLRRAIRLRRAVPLSGSGPLAVLYPTLNTAMERVATLARDREERLRLEGAVRRLTQAVEKSWLGLPWSWPDESGTLLDELVALLRTPNLERQPNSPEGDERTERSGSTALPWPLVPIPSAEVERERQHAEAALPHSGPRHTPPEFTPPSGGASSARWTPWT